MLPLIVFGQTPNTKRTTKAYRQFHPVHQQLVLTLLDEALYDEHGLYWVLSGDMIRGQEEAIQRYIEKNGVYVDLQEWPFPQAIDMEELKKNSLLQK